MREINLNINQNRSFSPNAGLRKKTYFLSIIYHNAKGPSQKNDH
jgi:hypothetical protein